MELTALSFLKKISPSLIVETCASFSAAVIEVFSSSALTTIVPSAEASTSSLSSIALSSAVSTGIAEEKQIVEGEGASTGGSFLIPFFLPEIGEVSTTKSEWKSSSNPFIFGSFELVNPLKEEKVSPASLSGEASSCLSNNSSEISTSKGRVPSVRMDDVVRSSNLHLKMLSLTCGDFSSFSLDGSLLVFVHRSRKAMYGRCGALHHTCEMFDVQCHRDSFVWTNMCKFTTNVGLGPPLENVAGVFTDTGWYATSQFNVDVIFGHRMKQYECLTHDSYIAVAIFIPFYAGFAFILAVVFRMEQLDWSSSSSLAKSLGTVVSIDGAEKVLANTPKTYCFGARQGPTIASTLDKGQATKIQEQENLLRAAVNADDGLRLPGDQRQITPTLPMHLADAHIVNKGAQYFPDGSGIYMKNTPLSSNSMGGQNSLLQTSGSQLLGRSTASPSTATSTTSLDNTTSSPIPYANSPRSSTNVMNTTEDSSGFFVSLLFGLGPLLGGIILVAFALGLVPVVLLLAIGATDSWHGTLATAAIIGFMGPISAIGAVLAGIDYNGLDHVMVLACSVC